MVSAPTTILPLAKEATSDLEPSSLPLAKKGATSDLEPSPLHGERLSNKKRKILFVQKNTMVHHSSHCRQQQHVSRFDVILNIVFQKLCDRSSAIVNMAWLLQTALENGAYDERQAQTVINRGLKQKKFALCEENEFYIKRPLSSDFVELENEDE